MLLAEGLRRYRVVAVYAETVEYVDLYPGPPRAAIRRESSRIMFELGLESGEVREIKPKKGGGE